MDAAHEGASGGMIEWFGVDVFLGAFDARSCLGRRQGDGKPPNSTPNFDAPSLPPTQLHLSPAARGRDSLQPCARPPFPGPDVHAGVGTSEELAPAPHPTEPSEPFAALRKAPPDLEAREGSIAERTTSASSSSWTQDATEARVSRVSPLVGAISRPGAFEFTLPHSHGWQGAFEALLDRQLYLAEVPREEFDFNRLEVTDFRGVPITLADDADPHRERFPLLIRYEHKIDDTW